ncbi:autotransporter domain-containing protein [Carnimonas bestiolae]|uniref:autotransporter domain-containing protein n=1 Tax=Carnimonas bestiolae TaxID=3402172 RepID=UPI003EDBC5C8
MKLVWSLSCGMLLGSLPAAQAIAIPPTFIGSLTHVLGNSKEWFDYASTHVVAPYPEPGSKASEWDRQATIDNYQAEGTPEREWAEQYSETSVKTYKTIFSKAVFGDRADDVNILAYSGFRQPLELALASTVFYDPSEKRFLKRFKEMVTEYKNYYNRPRPSDAFKDLTSFEWRDDYPERGGHSYISGHTTAGFGVATPFALLFPERGGEIYAQAQKIALSRLVRASHFGSDTIAARANVYFYQSKLLEDDNTRRFIIDSAKRTRAELGLKLGGNLRDIIEAQESPDDDKFREQGYSIGYYDQADEGATPGTDAGNLPTLSANLLTTRFPYLETQQRLQVLGSTAYPTDSLAGFMVKEGDPDSYWGVINLPSAFRGPTSLDKDFRVDQRITDDDVAGFGDRDTWSNDIAGAGKLIKSGNGQLELSGNNHFGGVELNEGTLLLSGDNDLQHDSVVHSGELSVDGSLTKALTVEEDGTLSGRGSLNDVYVKGGTVSPGDNTPNTAVGTLTTHGNITFDKDSHYIVDIDRDGNSDRIKVAGKAQLNGGQVDVRLANSGPVWRDISDLYDQHYTILSADDGIEGRFDDASVPKLQRPFLQAELGYTAHDVDLGINRNRRLFSDAAANSNQRGVARAVAQRDTRNEEPSEAAPNARRAPVEPRLMKLASRSLPPAAASLAAAASSSTAPDDANTAAAPQLQQKQAIQPQNGRSDATPQDPLYRAVALSESDAQARDAFNQLDGQLHADVIAATLDTDQQVVEGISNHLTFSPQGSGPWIRMLGSHTHMNAHGALEGYRSDNKGIQLGGELANDTQRAGVAFTYLDGRVRSNGLGRARSDNYYLTAYASQQFGDAEILGGAGYGWHNIDTHRHVRLADLNDNSDASTDSHSWQGFAEARYRFGDKDTGVTPYVRASYTHLNADSFTEDGGPQALRSNETTETDLRSALGVRVNHQQPLSEGLTLNLKGSAGWLHQWHDRDRERRFEFSDASDSFVTNSANAYSNAASVSAGAALRWQNGIEVSLDYAGLFAKGRDDHGGNLGVAWYF